VDHRLVNRVTRLVRENARAKARHELFNVSLLALVKDVVVPDEVISPELDFVPQVSE